jgi:hypothetical protein
MDSIRVPRAGPTTPPIPPVMMVPPRRVLISLNSLVLLFGLLLGILIFAGTASFHAALLIPIPCPQPYSYCQAPTDPAVLAYRNTVRTLGWVSALTLDLAVSFSVAMAWIAGASKGELPEGTRRGIFIFATVFLAVWLVFSWAAYAIFRAFVPFG